MYRNVLFTLLAALMLVGCESATAPDSRIELDPNGRSITLMVRPSQDVQAQIDKAWQVANESGRDEINIKFYPGTYSQNLVFINRDNERMTVRLTPATAGAVTITSNAVATLYSLGGRMIVDNVTVANTDTFHYEASAIEAFGTNIDLHGTTLHSGAGWALRSAYADIDINAIKVVGWQSQRDEWRQGNGLLMQYYDHIEVRNSTFETLETGIYRIFFEGYGQYHRGGNSFLRVDTPEMQWEISHGGTPSTNSSMNIVGAQARTRESIASTTR